jgi:prefoldin subunit 5
MNEVFIKVKGDAYLEQVFKDKDLISVDELIAKFQSLINDVEYLEKKVNELEADIRDNYRPITKEEMWGR